jgi:cyclopropane fatty-acyl-phospholipid synthase-like methyltransferase
MLMTQSSYRERIYSKYTSQKSVNYVNLTSKEYEQWGRTTLKYIEAWLPKDKNSRCLDVACGAGHLLHLYKSYGYTNITGIDISPEQVTASRKIWHDVHEVNAMDWLQQHTDTYDLISGLDIVEHFTKDELFEFVDALYGALKPDGILILQTVNADSPFALVNRYGDLTHELAFNSQSMTHILNAAGFAELVARECGPVISGVKSFIRFVLWKVIRFGIKIWNLVETGNPGSGVFTRIFLVYARKKEILNAKNI